MKSSFRVKIFLSRKERSFRYIAIPKVGIPITKSSEEKQCSEFGRSESNYERFRSSSQDDSDEEHFHKSPAIALSLCDCVLYKYFDAMFF